MTAPSSFTLERAWWMRLGGGPFLQPALLLLVVVPTLFVVRNGNPVLLVLPAVALVLWLLGATAWIRVDETGIHRRCYLRHDISWTDLRAVELRTITLGVNQARRQIRARTGHGTQWLAPATANGRRTAEFTRQLVTAARARGIAVDLSGWGGVQDW